MAVSFDVVPARLVVKAMQDSGYKNAAYAIAELIDNSIQAGADEVELLCIEAESIVNQRNRARLKAIAVLDNGSGMTSDILRTALQFGNGTHLGDRDGIGRFGMGLPNSSMSQGSRVEVWSWQDGPGSSIYSYIDVEEIAAGDMKEVPKPIKKEIPSIWKSAGRSFGDSGTLVVWPSPNRCTWKTALGVVRNSEEIVGRVYRYFINSGRAKIRLAAFRDTALDKPTIDDYALPNDPLYLMSKTSCSAPFDSKPMFEPWGKAQEIVVGYRGKKHKVKITCSIATKDARSGHDKGHTPHGKHAARNIGVSVVRADRELELDPRWMPSYDPRTRWIGVEIMFPPALDEIFGVTNNKQSATNLSDIAGADSQELATRLGYESYHALKQAWVDDMDMREPLLSVKDTIDSAIRTMMGIVKAQQSGARRKRYDKQSPEAVATEATKKRRAEGHVGRSDSDESKDPTTRKTEIESALADEGVDANEAHSQAAQTIDHGLKFLFAHTDSSAGAFFSVRPKGGTLLITLNTSHPAYDKLVGILEDEPSSADLQDLQDRHTRALSGLKLLLSAWARYEDELPDGPKRQAIQDAREDWGRVARQFLMG